MYIKNDVYHNDNHSLTNSILRNNSYNLKIVIGIIIFLFFLFILPVSVKAATYTVTKTANTNDGTCDSDCSFKEAVQAANSNSGADTINFNIPTTDGGYVTPSGDTQGYFSLSLDAISLTDDSGVFINGYSQSGASRNTAAFGQTLNTVLKIQIVYSNGTNFLFTGGNNHFAGINYQILSVHTVDLSIAGSSNNWIEGNYFGSDITGTTPTYGGSFLISHGGSSNTFGTNGDGVDDVGERNLFMGHLGKNYAITGYVWSDSNLAAGNSNIIAGNYFGVDKTGRTCPGATIYGQVIALASSSNRVGTNYDGVSDSEEANIIGCINKLNSSDNPRGFIRFFGNINNNLIQGNYIGISPNGNALGTLVGTGKGAVSFMSGGVYGNVIKGNTISNGDYGIYRPYSGQNTFSKNQIYGNSLAGIKLGTGSSPLLNDSGDTDSGANDLMNYPVLKKIVKSGTNLIVTADLDFQSSEAPFTIELFDNDSLHSSGHGEGKYFIGSASTSTTGSSVSLTVPITGTTPTSADKITSTATNTNGSTSEFSAAPIDTTLYLATNLSIISLDNSISSGANGKLRFSGTASTEQYAITDVQYSVNGGNWSSATATDGSFNSTVENYYFDFLASDNNYTGDGYTILVKTHNNNDVWTSNGLFFQPFNLDSPQNNYFTTNLLPTFSFSINKSRFTDLKDNLSKFRVLINKNNKGWQTYIDDIPVSYANVKDSGDNLQKGNGDSLNGIYENKKIFVSYSNNNANITVYSKPVDDLGNSSDKYFEDGGHKLSNGSYQWKIVATDKAGHSQETETRKIRVNSKQFQGSEKWFPLTVESVTGIGKLDLSTIHPQDVEEEYSTSYLSPTIRGIANAGTTVTLTKEDITCIAQNASNCTSTYTTTTEQDSRYAIPLSDIPLRYGRSYTISLSAKDSSENYNELPSFTLNINSPEVKEAKTEIEAGQAAPTPTIEQKEQNSTDSDSVKKKKRCVFFICW